MRHHVSIIIAGVTPQNSTLQLVYTSGDDALHNVTWAAGSYAVREGAIRSLGAFESAIDDGASVATSSVTSLVLPADDLSPIGSRPIDIFARLGGESLAQNQVWASDGMTAGATSIKLSSGTSQTYTPRILHIGTEAFQTTPALLPASGTVPISERGILGTIPAPHRADANGFLPRTIPVSKVPVEWIGRRVFVYIDGKLWKICILSDNPHVDAHSVVLSLIDLVNVLSVAKKSVSVPSWATTLAVQTIPLEYDVAVSRPEMILRQKIDFSMSGRADQFATSNGELSGGSAYSRERALGAMKWWEKSTSKYGTRGLPQLILRIQSATLAVAYDAELVGGTGAATLSGTCYLGPLLSSQIAAEIEAEGALIVYATEFRYSALTWWAESGLSSYLGTAADFASVQPWNAGLGYGCPWSLSYADGVLRAKSRTTRAVGYRYGDPARGLVLCMISRRNLAEGEEPEELRTAPSLMTGLYSDWQSGNNAFDSSRGPIRQIDGALPDYEHAFYPVRPTKDGDVHNVIVSHDGIVQTLDGFTWDWDLASASIPIDYCLAGRWWEPSLDTIVTTTEIPLVGTSGTVEIRWQEPSEEWLRATAEVELVGTVSAGYQYRISSVTMFDGSPCVGFGTWARFEPVQITPPTFAARHSLGYLAAVVVASTDTTGGGIGDVLGDGYGIPLSRDAYLSFLRAIPAATDTLFKFFAGDDLDYADFLALVCQITGSAIVPRLTDPSNLFSGYGPFCRPMGRPTAGEAVDSWTDDDFIGIPSTADGLAGPAFSSYSITLGDRHWTVPDWLAGDILGQGDELEIDLTPIVCSPRRVTDETIRALVQRLRDRFGVIRRRWSVRVPIEKALDLSVGDVVAVSSAYLVDPAGGLGVTDRLARILSISHDFAAAVSDVQLIAYASYAAGWNASWDVLIDSISGSPNTYSLSLIGAPSGNPYNMRAYSDAQNWAPPVDSTVLCYLVQTTGTGAGGYKRGYLTAWRPDIMSATFVQTASPASPAAVAGYEAVLIFDPSTIPASFADLFKLSRDRLA